jgi:putative CocE/NonD family hydrolase
MRIEENVPCELSDGTVLRSDIYRPDDNGSYPVLMLRLPYDKKTKRYYDEYLSVPRMVAAGYVVILQDVRGRFASGGEFYPFVHERKDGYEAVEWAAALPYANGKVGLFGMSYHGYTQLAAAVEAPPSLKAIAPVMTMDEPWTDMLTDDNALTDTASFMTWTLESILPDMLKRRGGDKANEVKKYTDDLLKWVAYKPASEWPPLKELDPDSFYFDFINRKISRETIDYIDVHQQLQDVTIPALFIGGWFDALLKPTMQAWQNYGGPAQLWIGPWTHSEMTGRAGEFFFGDSATAIGEDNIQDPTALHIRWFDHWLKDKPLGIEKPVHLYKMGQKKWDAADHFPGDHDVKHFYLDSDGDAASLMGDGILAGKPASGHTSNLLPLNPENPVPSYGGNSIVAGQEAGMFDQRKIQSRDDVLVFTGSPLETDLNICGLVQAEIWASSPSSLMDVFIRISDVYPDGSAYNIVDAMERKTVKPDEPVRIDMAINYTAYRLQAGHRLRVDIAASNAPHFDVNQNTGATSRFAAAGKSGSETIYHSVNYQSKVIIPTE